MAKDGIHPNYSTIKIKTFKDEEGNELVFFFFLVNGEGKTMTSEMNIYKHQAWKKGSSVIDQDNITNRQMDTFFKKFKYKVEN